MSSTTVYLVFGTNRGIDLGLVTILAARPSTIVFAGARNPSSASDLHALQAKYPGKSARRQAHLVNVVGTLVLFQATYPLLKASTPSPKFIPFSSGAGSITDGARIPVVMLAYGASKAGENYLARKLHFEYDGLVCFPMNPGGVGTDMADCARDADPMMQPMPLITVAESATKILEQVDGAVREEDGPNLVNLDGATWAW